MWWWNTPFNIAWFLTRYHWIIIRVPGKMTDKNSHSGARVMHHLSIRTNCVIMFCHFEQMLENFMILTYVSQDQCNFFLLQVVWNRLKLISGVNYKWSIQSFYEICEFSKIKTPSKSSISPERSELALTLSKTHGASNIWIYYISISNILYECQIHKNWNYFFLFFLNRR